MTNGKAQASQSHLHDHGDRGAQAMNHPSHSPGTTPLMLNIANPSRDELGELPDDGLDELVSDTRRPGLGAVVQSMSEEE